MPTYLDVTQRIGADLLNRTDLNPEIGRAINQCIRSYENQRFWFNETQSSLLCVVNNALITKPADFLMLTRLEVVQNGNADELIEKDLDFIRQINSTTSTSLPSFYCEYGASFMLADIPDSAYAVNCFYVHKLPALSATTDTNKWLSAAEDVVVYGAAKYVTANMGNAVKAAEFGAIEKMFYQQRLVGQRDQTMHSRLRNTQF